MTFSADNRPRLVKLSIKNFRCIGPEAVEIEVDDVVVLVGPNNAGKSSILRAYELATRYGTKESTLTLADFPGEVVDAENLPEILWEMVIHNDKAPAEKWIDRTRREGPIVSQKLIWAGPDVQPKIYSKNVDTDSWADDDRPWGAPNVARAALPEAHRIGAFDDPAKQSAELVKLLTTIVTTSAQSSGTLERLNQVRNQLFQEASDRISEVEKKISNLIGEVFPGYAVRLDTSEAGDSDIEKIMKSGLQLRMGPVIHGHQSPIDRQGSGARRTLLWSALRILADHGKEATVQPHMLLLDEPELCLHPDAIREARRVLYSLPDNGAWQVIMTTHSPVFIDIEKRHTSVVRVARARGVVVGTTIFRPPNACFDATDRELLQMMNHWDPYLAEFFFGGRTVVVEGDTEYAAFQYLIGIQPDLFRSIHIVRARGKAPIVTLCKILNQFGTAYSVLHDSDSPRDDNGAKSSAWTQNYNILHVLKNKLEDGSVRLVASIRNFEYAFLGNDATEQKPYEAVAQLRLGGEPAQRVTALLRYLAVLSDSLPPGGVAWSDMEQLENAFACFTGLPKPQLGLDFSNAAATTGISGAAPLPMADEHSSGTVQTAPYEASSRAPKAGQQLLFGEEGIK